MGLDKRVLRALDEAVAEAGEERPLAQKLGALMEALANGNARLSDRDSAARHIELLFDQVSDQTLNE
jgi:hypothetical protein